MTRAPVVLAVLDAALLALVPGWPHVAAAMHLLLTLAAVVVWLRDDAPGMAVAVAVPLGPVAMLLARMTARSARGPGMLPLLPTRPDPRAMGDVGRLLDGRIRHSAPEALGSLAAILRHGDISSRRSALEAVVRSFEPALSPLVLLALSDRDQTIRALAAAAAARITQNFMAARERLEAAGDLPALTALLAEHARANVLLSETQRAQLHADVIALLPPGRDDDLRAEAAWAARDYAALDEIAAHAPAPARWHDWWRAEPA
ncbi:hypothetical protein ASG29_15280 [Sphingomonas sp. Leaf412]|uniref:hypothetical protein n=1 Tax=Sphingomonas sp. Leaf412 TaxID=1736370 RepID=UPI0006F5DF0D|nr:hypothetical protein [Sphingomonas sp. Leaf412]KQT31320.1 hypothetical protein ASG29_15280 [Sphingomonas sp. Leaf412]